MPAAGEKKEFVAELDADPLKEMTKQAQDFIKQIKTMSKKFANVTYKEKVELDPRKWKKKDLNDGVFAVARYELKLLAVRVGKAAKDGAADDKTEAELSKEYDKIVKAITKKLSLAIEELANDKGNNKKALKDGKAAFAKLDKINFNGAFSGPRNQVVSVLKALEKAVSGRNAQAAFGKAAAEIAKIAAQFDKVGREANAAIAFLMKSAKEHEKADDSGLQDFAKEIQKSDKVFQPFLDEADAFEKALDDVEKSVKDSTLDAAGVKAKITEIQRMSSVDKSAQSALGAARKLKPAFLKIEKSLK